MSFAERVEVLYGTPTGMDGHMLIILVPCVTAKGRFYLEQENTYPLRKLIKDSEVRHASKHVVLITQMWMWNRYLRQSAELAQENAGV